MAKNNIHSVALSCYQVLGALYGIHGPARIMNWFFDVANGEDRDTSELFPITQEERQRYEWKPVASEPLSKHPLAKWMDEHGTENVPASLIGIICDVIAAAQQHTPSMSVCPMCGTDKRCPEQV